jgi:hypothetical protein
MAEEVIDFAKVNPRAHTRGIDLGREALAGLKESGWFEGRDRTEVAEDVQRVISGRHLSGALESWTGMLAEHAGAQFAVDMEFETSPQEISV